MITKRLDEFLELPECCLKCEHLDSTEPAFMSLERIEYFCTKNIMFPVGKLSCKSFRGKEG